VHCPTADGKFTNDAYHCRIRAMQKQGISKRTEAFAGAQALSIGRRIAYAEGDQRYRAEIP